MSVVENAQYEIADENNKVVYKVTKCAPLDVKTRKDKLIATVNSSIFIWFLSTVLVSGVTQLYKSYTNRKVVEKTLREQENKVKSMDLEIESRLSQFLSSMQPMINFTSDTTYELRADSIKAFIELVAEIKRPPSHNRMIFTLCPEYQEVSLASLVMLQARMLIDLGHDVNEAKENGFENWKDFETKDINKEIGKIKKAGRCLITISLEDYRNKKDNSLNVKAFLRRIFEGVILSRWQMQFPYVDCGYRVPFC